MVKAGDRAKRFTLRAFAAAGRAEEDEGPVFHGDIRLYRKLRAQHNIDACASNDQIRMMFDHFRAASGSTFTRRPARSKRTLPSTNAKIV